MKHSAIICVTLMLTSSGTIRAFAAEASSPGGIVEVKGGAVVFDANTNVPAVSIHGKSTAMSGKVLVRRTAAGLELEQVEAIVSPKSFTTGMSLRDEHMRKYIFQTEDGQMPDLRFAASRADCPGGRESTCQMTGTMHIRGVARPFKIALKVREEGAGTFRAAGDTVIKLSEYGIPAPSQFGVKTTDDVKLHLELTGKLVSTTASRAGVGR